MPDQSRDKTEKATPKRREDARKKGNVARSLDVNSALVLFAGTIVLSLTSDYFFGSIRGMMQDVFSQLPVYEISVASVRFYTVQAMMFLLKLLAPLLLTVLLVSTTANVLQVGFLISGEPLKPDLKKINPVNGLKRLFSIKSTVELVKGLLKISVIGVVVYVTISGAAKEIVTLMDQSITQVVVFLSGAVLKMALRASIALVILAALDYCFTRWDYEKNLRMTKLEVKEEIKELEGSPLIKSRIRNVQRETSYKRMMSEVPKADVIITNPVHCAIALRYVSGEMNAPVVIAKGAKGIAKKIKTSAEGFAIPVVEDPPLARALFKKCELGMETPEELYKGVAEILASVYRSRQKGIK